MLVKQLKCLYEMTNTTFILTASFRDYMGKPVWYQTIKRF